MACHRACVLLVTLAMVAHEINAQTECESGECHKESEDAEVMSVSLLQNKVLVQSQQESAALDGDSEDAIDMESLSWAKGFELLEQRETTNTSGSNCFSTVTSALKCGTASVTDAAKCGTSTITNAAKCGTDTIQNAAKCGSSTKKLCKWKKGKLRCSFKSIAKSCSVPKSCNVPNTCKMPNRCDVAFSFKDCLTSLKSAVGSGYKKYVNMVTDSGCTGLTKCQNAVLKGLDEVWSLLAEQASNMALTYADRALDEVPYVRDVIDGVKEHSGTVADMASSLSSQVSEYMGGKSGPKKWDLNNLCTGDGEGFFYMVPTDCGLFDKMEDLLKQGPSKAAANFKSAGNKLDRCVKKTGMFDFPTPFMNLEVEKYCLPDFMVLPFEYMLGGIIWGSSTALDGIAALTKVIGDKLCLLLEESGVTLSDLGGLIQQDVKQKKLGLAERREARKASGRRRKALDDTLGDAADFFKDKADDMIDDLENGLKSWHVGLALQGDASITAPNGVAWTVSIGFKIYAGMIDGEPSIPNVGIFIAFANGISAQVPVPPEPVVPQTGVTIGIGFADGATAFDNRAAAGAGFDIIPSVDLAAIGIPAALGVPFSFGVLPSVSAPSSFTIEVSPETSGLVEMGKEFKTKVSEASRAAYERGEDSVTAGLHQAIKHFATDPRLDDALKNAKLNTKETVKNVASAYVNRKEAAAHKLAVEKAALEGSEPPEKFKSDKVPSVLEKKSSKQEPGDITLQASVAFELCVTPDIGPVKPCEGASVNEITPEIRDTYAGGLIDSFQCVMDFIGA